MTDQLLNIACGLFLLTAVGVLWRRELAALITLITVQGAALTGIAVLLAVEHHHVETLAVAGLIGVLKIGILPWVLRRVLARVPEARETAPLVNVAASLLAAAALTLLAYAAARPIVELASSPTARATPVGVAVVLIGFFLAATRRRAISQIVGILLIDNGVAAVAFLATGGVPLVVELGVSADLLLAVLVLQVLTTRLRAVFGGTDLDDLRELHD